MESTTTSDKVAASRFQCGASGERKTTKALARLHSARSFNHSHCFTAEGWGSSLTPLGLRSSEALEAQLRKDVEQLTNRIQSEHEGRTETVKNVTTELHKLTRQLDDKILELSQSATDAQEDIRQQLVDEAKLLSTQIDQQADNLQASLEQEVEQLDHNKLNRADIAQMFSEMAKRIVGEKGK